MQSNLKPVIKLWDAPGWGIIISHPTGVLFSNQTGGTGCNQPELEGIYLPLYNELATFNPEETLIRYFTVEKYAGTGATYGIDEDDANYIETLLSTYGLPGCIEVDRQKLRKSHEAWVHVIVYTEKYRDILSNFGESLPGVLTWCNSD